ncbi:MAG: Amidohydrolase [Lentisphaerae bacterium ADurb.Bin242]|nr:MAG: Amidohydrolase [Lentisphaerae bacterium ADurb.Bin242]
MNVSIWEKSGSLANTFWEKGSADFPIYDMHGHMGSHYAIYMKRCEAPEMAAHMKRIGVKRLVFSHHEVLWGNMRNAEVVEICKRFPGILRMYVGIVPQYPERIREDLAMFDRWKPYAVGLKFLADYHRIPVTDKAYEYALKFADERGIPVLNHTWGKSPYNGGPVMLEAARKYPNVKFFMGHSIFGEWDYAERCVKETHGNVWLELTAIPGEFGLIEKLVSAVGSERILYGTDLPWFDEYQAVGGVLSAKITENDMRNILYRNAEHILGKEW